MNNEPNHPSVGAVRRRIRVRGDRPGGVAGSPPPRRRGPGRGGRVSEAVVAGYIQELSQRQRGEHGVASAPGR